MGFLAIVAALAGEAMVQQSPMPAAVAQSWSCDARKTCGKIRSCEEAEWYLANCSWGGKLDNDDDGAPCESMCGSNN